MLLGIPLSFNSTEPDTSAQDAVVEVAGSQRAIGTPVADPAMSTLKLYAGEWASFVAWCHEHRRTPLPAADETLKAYLLAGASELSRGTIGRRRSAVAAMHRHAGLPPPRLDAAGRKALRLAAKPPVAAAVAQRSGCIGLERFAAKCPQDSAGLRDRALLLLVAAIGRPRRRTTGSAAAGTEKAIPRLLLLALDAEDIRFTSEGVALQLRTRADEPAPSRSVTLARSRMAQTCPVRALEVWLRSSDTAYGPVFRKVDRWGNVEHARLRPDAWFHILARRGGARRMRTPSKVAR